MKLKSLTALKRPEREEIVLAELPEQVWVSRFALEKAFKICELVRTIHGASYEWYGFTVGRRSEPSRVIDIGLPQNDQNVHDYTGIGPEGITRFQESLPHQLIINGWIHSHGNLGLRTFSATDARNHVTVLDYVTALARIAVAKREILIEDLALCGEDEWRGGKTGQGSVSLVTDARISRARLFETVFGGFAYAILVGDEGWHEQQIHYKRRGILTGETTLSYREAPLTLFDTHRALSKKDIALLSGEVRGKILPLESAGESSLERA